jgi:cytochrome P450
LGGRKPTYQDLAALPYTLQVLKESLRLYPPSSIILRGALKDTDLLGYPIKKGQMVFFSQYLLHRREESFPEPEKFEPERFKNEKEIGRYAYLPFGAGHRVCIGSHFALMEGHLILATLIQKLKFEPVSPEEVKPELVVTLRPSSKIQVRVTQKKPNTKLTM